MEECRTNGCDSNKQCSLVQSEQSGLIEIVTDRNCSKSSIFDNICLVSLIVKMIFIFEKDQSD